MSAMGTVLLSLLYGLAQDNWLSYNIIYLLCFFTLSDNLGINNKSVV